MPASRRLAAILAADVVGYSRMMGEDEEGTARSVREAHEAAAAAIALRGGRMFKTMGDGFLAEFPSVVAAVECALVLQAEAERHAQALPAGRRLRRRMGIHLGDVLVEGDDLIGDGVNIAARLEGIASPGGVYISAAAYENVQGRLDARLTDLGEKTLKNIARPIRVYGVAASDKRSESAAPRGGPPRLSLVVLPFGNLGGGPEQEYFVDGVTESLTTDLSRIAGAVVIGRNTAFAFRGKALDTRELGRDLNVRYVLEGSVQRSGDRMRVNVQLIEAETAAHVWAERFDKPVADLFEMQDEIVARIANQLSAEIVRVEARRAEAAANPDALDFWFRGTDWINRGISPDSLVNARDCFDRALAIDPANVNATLGKVMVAAIETRMRALAGPSEVLTEAEALVTHALAKEPNNARGRYCLALVLMFSRRTEQAIAELERALALDPNMAFAHAQIGFAKCILGRPEETEAHVKEAMRLSPRDPGVYIWYDYVCVAKTMMGQDEDAVPWGRKAAETNRGYPMAHFHYAAPLALRGRVAEARSEVKSGLALAPNFTIRRYREDKMSDNPVYLSRRERILEGLRLAGAPEE
jgi:TolB-like protein/Flp pilus assembly protein TadD